MSEARSSIELVLLAPIIGLLLLAVVAVGRVQSSRADVEGAARSAARDLSIARDPLAAVARVPRVDGRDVGRWVAWMSFAHLHSVDHPRAGDRHGACDADLQDAAVLPLPGAMSLSATATEVIDVFRGGAMRTVFASIRRRAVLDDERGSATVWMIGVVVASFVMIGLVLDGGAMLRARSDAFAAASAAARAGAQQLDPVEAVEGRAVLDPVAAERAAIDSLTTQGFQGSATVNGDVVTVEITSTADLQMLQLLGGDTATFHATASAQAVKVTP